LLGEERSRRRRASIICERAAPCHDQAALAARYKLPAVYNNPFPVTGGGLIF
jgi:hypothetical protein